jgi:tetratricopeptide (TPR) repeat protein
MGQKSTTGTNKKQQKPWVLIAFYLVLFILGIAGGIFVGPIPNLGELSLPRLLLLVVYFFAALFININIHEFGHYIFGRLFGYKLISYRISVLSWNNENSKMKFSIMRNKGYSGLCAMIPPEQELSNFKHGLYIAGGFLLNVLTGSLFLAAASMLSGPPRDIMFVTGILAIILATINFLPIISANNHSDGKILWGLILKKPSAHKLIETIKVGTQLSAGTRPRDLQITPPEVPSNPQVVDLMPVLCMYFKALDENNLEDIFHYAGLLEDNIEYFPSPILPGIYNELCHTGCIANDETKARKYYQKAGKILQADKDTNGLRVKAYYEYYINANPESALKYIEEALAVVDKFPIKGQGLMEADLVRTLRDLIVSGDLEPKANR